MKLVATLGMILGAVVIVGCGSSAPRAQVPVGIMQVAEEELSHSIGTTTLTSAVVAPVAKAARPAHPPYLTVENEPPAPARTWGAAPSEQESAEADLAQNPYTVEHDIYDPR